MLENEESIHHPLRYEDIALIESTNLSHIDKHYLRLLAHCLNSFKSMVGEASFGDIPSREMQIKWFKRLKPFQGDDSFLQVFLDQLDVAAKQLEKLAEKYSISPLELTIEHLVGSANVSQDNQ